MTKSQFNVLYFSDCNRRFALHREGHDAGIFVLIAECITLYMNVGIEDSLFCESVLSCVLRSLPLHIDGINDLIRMIFIVSLINDQLRRVICIYFFGVIRVSLVEIFTVECNRRISCDLCG